MLLWKKIMDVFFVVFSIFLCDCFVLSNAKGLYHSYENVTVFNGKNFVSTMSQSPTPWLIEFYVDWCGHCQEFAYAYKALAKDIADWSWLFRIGAINCEDGDNYLTCHQAPFWISDYPEARIFPSYFDADSGEEVKTDVSMGEMRKNIVRIIEDNLPKQQWNHSTRKPDLSPVGDEFLLDIAKSRQRIKYLAIVFEDERSSMGKEIILDMSSCGNIVIRRSIFDESIKKVLQKEFFISETPPFVLVSTARNSFVLDVDYKTRYFYTYKLRNLPYVGKPQARTLNLSSGIEDFYRDDVLETNLTYLADIESGLYHMLAMEVSANKEISGRKLTALQKLVHLFALVGDNFPGRRSTIAFLRDLYEWIAPRLSISSSEWLNKVREKKDRNYLPSMSKNWIECLSTEDHMRGYPCSLWIIFHALSVAAYKAKLDKHLLPDAMQGYVVYFFGCHVCRENFKKEIKKIPFRVTDSDFDAILWLWKIHNEVNQRLSKHSLSSYPKLQFPPTSRCPLCRDLATHSWRENSVAKFLIQQYSKENINWDYLGNLEASHYPKFAWRLKKLRKKIHPKKLHPKVLPRIIHEIDYPPNLHQTHENYLRTGMLAMCFVCILTLFAFAIRFKAIFRKMKLF